MPDRTWKRRERELARLFATERNALSGGNSKVTRSDSLSKAFYLESKYRSQKSSLFDLYDDTKQKAQVESKIPVIGLSQKGKPGFLIVLHSNDLEQFCIEYLRAID